MKKIGVLVLCLLAISFVSAYKVNVMVMDDPDSFSGGVLKFKSVSGSEWSDKVYPSKNYANVGILFFDVETSLSESNLKIVFTKGGSVVNEFESDALDMTQKNITINLKGEEPIIIIGEGKKEIENTTEEVIENVTEVVENTTEEVSVEEVENTTEEVIEEDSFSWIVTGKAIFVDDNGSFKLIPSILTSVVLLSLVIFLGIAIVKKHKVKKVDKSEEDKELEEVERKLKEKEAEIKKIAEEKAKKQRLEVVKKRLEEEERRLEELKGEDSEESKDL